MRQTGMPWHTEDPPQNWRSPDPLYRDLEERFAGRRGFMLDAAADKLNAKAPFYFDEDSSALDYGRPWHPRSDTPIRGDAPPEFSEWWGCLDVSVWCNPPYDSLELWVPRAYREVACGHCRLVCMLIPARVSMPWWQEIVRPHAWHVEFIDGRVKFDPPPGVEATQPFEHSAVVVFARGISVR